MNILPAHLAALCRLGYSDQEARFMYLVATHSGYFTRPQFLRFTRQTKGGILHCFTTKLLALARPCSGYRIRSADACFSPVLPPGLRAD